MATDLPSQRLLLATDFSPAAEAAFHQALWMAATTGGKLTIVHVAPDLRRTIHSASVDAKLDLLYGDGDHFFKEVRSERQRRLDALVEEAAARKIEVHTKLLVGEPYVEVCRMAMHSRQDLVFVGAHGHTTWQDYFLGSTAKRLVHNCPAPVWAVKPAHWAPPSVMLAATDFSPVSRLAVEAAIQLTSATSGELHLLHVIDSSDVPDSVIGVSTVDNSLRQRINASAMQRFEEFMAGLPQLVRIRPHLSWGTPWREINRLVQEVHAELLVIGSIGRSGISGMLLGNTAERLLGSCSSSVLTLKPADFHCPIPVQEAEFSATASTTLIG